MALHRSIRALQVPRHLACSWSWTCPDCMGGIILGSDGSSNRVKKGLAKLHSYIHVMGLWRYRILWPTLEQLEKSLKCDFRLIWSSWAPNPKSSKVALSTNFCQDFLTSDWLEDLHFWSTLADFSQLWNPLLGIQSSPYVREGREEGSWQWLLFNVMHEFLINLYLNQECIKLTSDIRWNDFPNFLAYQTKRKCTI